MPRRGKAATRHARQRRADTRPSRAAATALPDAAPEVADATPEPTDAPATFATPRARGATGLMGTSALSARARDEYHYVGRDLRNIGILAGVMLVILIVAFVIFRLAGGG